VDNIAEENIAKKEQGGGLCSKKEQGASPAPKIVSTLFPRKLDLILIDGVTLLVRAGLLPRLGPPDFNLSVSLRRHW